MDSVDSVETVDKTPSILQVYRGYSAGIGGVFRREVGGSWKLSVCRLSVVGYRFLRHCDEVRRSSLLEVVGYRGES